MSTYAASCGLQLPRFPSTLRPRDIAEYTAVCRVTHCSIRHRIHKDMENILNHALEIITLLTGEEKKNKEWEQRTNKEKNIVSLLQHLTKSLVMTEVKKDKKMTDLILNHTLEIIYLLTGEEYSIVKRISPQLTGEVYSDGECDVTPSQGDSKSECDVDGCKMMVENCQATRCVGISTNRSSDLQDESIDTESEEDDMQVTIHSDACAGVHDDDIYTVSINEDGEYESEEEKHLEIHPYPHTDDCVSREIRDESYSAACSSEEDGTSLSPKGQTGNSEGRFHRQKSTLASYKCVPKSYALNKRCRNKFSCASYKIKEVIEKSEDDRTAACEGDQLPITGDMLNENQKQVILQSNLQVTHPKSHKVKEPFVCPECDMVFTIKSQLVKHQRAHTGEKPYVCQECGKGFADKSNLGRHSRTHTGERAHICQICGKSFTQMSSLYAHRRIHTGEKPYICAVCGKGFSQRPNLERHNKTHTNEKPYVCRTCGKGFAQRPNMERHHKIHTGVKL